MTISTDPESLYLKKVTETFHPDYVKNIVEWQFLRQSLEGGKDYVKGNLFKHPQEEPEVYACRSIRAADNHFNISQLVTDTYEGYIFQNPPTETEGIDPLFHAFILKADLEGKPAVCLAQELLHWLAAYGVMWLAYDKPAISEPVASAAQELDAGLIPYAYLIHPTHVLNGRITRGIVDWLLVQEDVLDNSSPWSSSGALVTQWRIWEPHQQTLITVQTDQAGVETYTATVSDNQLGEVPIIPFYFTEAEGFACKSLLSDIAHMDRAIFNKCSLLDEIHYAATFPQLAVPYDGDLYTENGLTGEGKAILTMGLNSVLPYHSAAGIPSYVAPPSGPAETLERSIQSMIQRALSLALLDGEIAKDGHTKSASSGVSKAYIFEKLNRRLANIADTLEQGFQRGFGLVARWMNRQIDLTKTVWNFPDNFEVRSLAQEIADAIALLAAGIPSDTAKKIMFKNLVRKAYPNLTPEQLIAIDKEIDAFDYTQMNVHWMELAVDSGIAPGKPKPTGNPNHDPIANAVERNAAGQISQAFGGGAG